MKGVLSFSAGVLCFLELWATGSLYLASYVISHPIEPTKVALVLGTPVLGALLAGVAYFCGLKVFDRQSSLQSSYFLGLLCGLIVLGAYWLLGSRFIRFPLGMYGHIVGPAVCCTAGFLSAVFSARSAG